MRASGGLQGWMERRASALAFALAFVSMVGRAAQAYGAGAFNLARLLGPRGLAIFDVGTGLGLAVGAELLASIAGRARQAAMRELREAQGRPGIKRGERAALVAACRDRARQATAFCAIGLAASLYGAGAFLWSTTPPGLGSRLGDGLIAVLAVSIVFYLGALHEGASGPDAGTLARERSRGILARVVDAAGARVAAGRHDVGDLHLLAAPLGREERGQLLGALLPRRPDDPQWTARDVAAWLGCEADDSARRQIRRKLAAGEASAAAGVARDPITGAYTLSRSAAYALFGDDMERRTRGGGVTVSARTPRGRSSPPMIRLVDPGPDPDRTELGPGQAAAYAGEGGL